MFTKRFLFLYNKYMRSFIKQIIIIVIFLTSIAFATEITIIPIKGIIDRGLSEFIQRNIQQANENNTDIIILDINTPGGRVDAAIEISDSITNSNKRTISYINKQAISAGAIIAISSPEIFINTEATFGDVEPIPNTEKNLSFIKSKLRTLAENNNYDMKIAEAMADKSLEIPGLIEKNKLLTFTTKEAIKHKFAIDSAANIKELINKLNISKYNISYAKETLADKAARIATHPMLSSILLTIGFLGILIEMQAPGFGFPGAIGIISILLFFGGHLISGLAGFESLILFSFGVALLVLEIFAFTGFGIAGFAGIAAIIFSIFLVFGNVTTTLVVIMPAISVCVLMVLYLLFFLQDSYIAKKISLKTKITAKDEPSSKLKLKVNNTGYTESNLRPSGKAKFDGQVYDVIAKNNFINPGKKIIISRISGHNIYVEETSEE